ncbi:MAG TPA: elongation factor 4 [Candidatus Pacebacteria bacterium]|nr:elongation factor 4 [Candidatus Paceibacterota bacterium]
MSVQLYPKDTSAIRNFSIIAHIDHGKTTLTDAFLKATHTVSDLNFTERMMDSNPIEKEKGVTIKLAPVRMRYDHQGKTYELNLIDTPGHVDFGYEVSRSLAACEGAILLIDASQGIQAQTLANYQKALDLGLTIIPVINKIDLPSADLDQTILECLELLNQPEENLLFVSAKTGQGVTAVLTAIIDRIPAPVGTSLTATPSDLRALVITSVFDNHQGSIAYVRVVDGELIEKTPLYLRSSRVNLSPIEIGYFNPERTKTPVLHQGEVGYVATGLKDTALLKIGDTLTTAAAKDRVQPLPGYKEPTPMVFMELYPIDTNDFVNLKEAMGKLVMHDSALKYQSTHSLALGNGLRVGFLGIFHAEVVRERLQREFDLDLIATAPSVSYQVLTTTGTTLTVNNPAEFPDPSLIAKILEPIAKVLIFVPEAYVGPVLKLTREKRGELRNTLSAGSRTQLEYTVPLAELITDFHDKLKSVTSGYASLEYELRSYQPVDAIKVSILANHEIVEALSFISVRDLAEQRGRNLVKKLKEVIPQQLFEVPIQAAIGGKVIARETIKAHRKDVTAKLYGGDRTRRMKLLKKQAKGKKRLKQIGRVQLNQEAFLAVLSSDD